MGGSDFFCSVSGGRYFYGRQEFRYKILEDAQDAEDSEGSDDEDEDFGSKQGGALRPKRTIAAISDVLKDGLLYSDEDVESSSKFVLLCPYERREDGSIVLHSSFDAPHPTEFTESNITEVFNIIPGRHPDLGGYMSEDPNDNGDYTVSNYGTTLIVAQTAYYILKQAAPDVKPHMIYALAYTNNPGTQGHIEQVDYGPVNYIMGQYAFWAGICGNGDYDDAKRVWKNLLTQKEKTDQEILYDAWRGPGNMWVFVRPDRFPIAETLAAEPLPTFPIRSPQDAGKNLFGAPTLETVPLDVLLNVCEFLPIRTIFALMTTCKRFRAQILPHANAISHRRLIEDEPWYLPVGPFTTSHGKDELSWWQAQWAAQGIPSAEITTKAPWLLYRRECSKSMSMWNRKRIWGVAKQIEVLSKKNGLL